MTCFEPMPRSIPLTNILHRIFVIVRFPSLKAIAAPILHTRALLAGFAGDRPARIQVAGQLRIRDPDQPRSSIATTHC
jgi:hypothetical protein